MSLQGVESGDPNEFAGPWVPCLLVAFASGSVAEKGS